jgi:FAR-17a/AIG1-like protein
MVNTATIVGWPVSSEEHRDRQKQRQQQQQQQQEMHPYQEMGSYKALNEVEQQMKDSLYRHAQYRLQKIHPLISAGARYKAEFFLCSAPFSIHDVPTGRIIDMDRTFHPRPFWLALALKTVLVLWAWSLLISGLLDTLPIWFYFAYLTIWSLTLSCIYLTLSWVVTVLPFLTTSQPSPPTTTHDTNSNDVSLWISATWLLYTIAAPAELLVAVLYWTVEWDWTTADEKQEITYRMQYADLQG